MPISLAPTARAVAALMLPLTLALAGCATTAPTAAGRPGGQSQTPAPAAPQSAPAAVGAAESDLSSVDAQLGSLDSELNQASTSMNASEGDPTR